MKRLVATGDKLGITYIDPGHAWELVHAGKALDLARELGWQPSELAQAYPLMAFGEAVRFIAEFVALPFAGVGDE